MGSASKEGHEENDMSLFLTPNHIATMSQLECSLSVVLSTEQKHQSKCLTLKTQTAAAGSSQPDFFSGQRLQRNLSPVPRSKKPSLLSRASREQRLNEEEVGVDVDVAAAVGVVAVVVDETTVSENPDLKAIRSRRLNTQVPGFPISLRNLLKNKLYT